MVEKLLFNIRVDSQSHFQPWTQSTTCCERWEVFICHDLLRIYRHPTSPIARVIDEIWLAVSSSYQFCSQQSKESIFRVNHWCSDSNLFCWLLRRFRARRGHIPGGLCLIWQVITYVNVLTIQFVKLCQEGWGREVGSIGRRKLSCKWNFRNLWKYEYRNREEPPIDVLLNQSSLVFWISSGSIMSHVNHSTSTVYSHSLLICTQMSFLHFGTHLVFVGSSTIFVQLQRVPLE